MKHYSIRTEQAYVDWIKRYIFFHPKAPPADMGEVEIEAFVSRISQPRKKVTLRRRRSALCSFFIAMC